MKKITVLLAGILLLAAAMLLLSCGEKEPSLTDGQQGKGQAKVWFEITDAQLRGIGITRAELEELYAGDEEPFSIAGYVFFTAKDGRNVMLHLRDNAVDTFRVYEKRESLPTLEDCEAVEAGTGIGDLVALIGIPKSSSTFGALTMNFETQDHRLYCFYFDNDTSMRVTDGRLLE